MLTLPLYPGLTRKQVNLVAATFHKAVDAAAQALEK